MGNRTREMAIESRPDRTVSIEVASAPACEPQIAIQVTNEAESLFVQICAEDAKALLAWARLAIADAEAESKVQEEA